MPHRTRASVAPIGLINMLNAGGSLSFFQIGASTRDEASLIARIGVRGSGTLLAYASAKPRAVAVNGVETGFGWDGTQGALRVEVPESEGTSCEVNVMLPS